MKLIKSLLILTLTFTFINMNAQDRYLTRSGHIKFFSSAPLEDIEAHNYKALSIVDLSKGQIAVDLLIKAFEFEKRSHCATRSTGSQHQDFFVHAI